METRHLDFILAVRRLPLGLFGYRRRDVERLADELQTEDQVEAQRWSEMVSERTAAIALTNERMETLTGVLEEVERDCDRLSAQVEQVRESADLLERGAQVEVERLKAQHADRMQQIRQMLPGIDVQIAEADDNLMKLRDALKGILATDITDGKKPSGQEFADVAAAIFGSAHPPNSIIGSWVGGGRVRIQIDATRVRVQSRGGVPVGYLSGLVVEGFPPQVLGYELTVQGEVQGTVPAADVVAVQVNVVIVREGYHVLPPEELTEEAGPRIEPARTVREVRGRGRGDATVSERAAAASPPPSDTKSSEAKRAWVRRPGAFRQFRSAVTKSVTHDAAGGDAARSPKGSDTVFQSGQDPLAPETLAKMEAQRDPTSGAVEGVAHENPETVDSSAANMSEQTAPAGIEVEPQPDLAMAVEERLETPKKGGITPERGSAGSDTEASVGYSDPEEAARRPDWPAAGRVEVEPQLDLAVPVEDPMETVAHAEEVPGPPVAPDKTDAELPVSSVVAFNPDDAGANDLHQVSASPHEKERDWPDPEIQQTLPVADSGPWWEEDLPLPGVARASEPSSIVSSVASNLNDGPGLDVLPGLSRPEAPLELPPPTWQAGDRYEMLTAAPVGRSPAARRPNPPPPRAPVAPAPEGETPPASAVGVDVLAFLVGKIVGQDILDGQQQLIAAQGSVIDQALVERVEAAGRLPELIVYMTIPGLES